MLFAKLVVLYQKIPHHPNFPQFKLLIKQDEYLVIHLFNEPIEEIPFFKKIIWSTISKLPF